MNHVRYRSLKQKKFLHNDFYENPKDRHVKLAKSINQNINIIKLMKSAFFITCHILKLVLRDSINS